MQEQEDDILYNVITSEEQLVKEIADALGGYYDDYNSFYYLSITHQTVDWRTDPDVTGEDDGLEDGEEIVKIEHLSSRESFEIMEAFADAQTGIAQNILYRALGRRHPFSNFNYATTDCNLRQEWYKFRDEALKEKAREWMKINDVEFKNGKIVAKHTLTWSKETEDCI